MIDFVKLQVKDRQTIQSLRNNSLLSFKQSTNRLGANNGIIAEFHGITFCLYHDNTAEIRGSLHKFWNSYIKRDSLHNWNDFTQSDLTLSVETLCTLFELNPTVATIRNIEFGVNVELPTGQTATGVLQRFLTFGTKKFEVVDLSSPGYYTQAALTDFFVKAYDKGTQYDRPNQIVRFEKKAIAMKNVPGISTLSDLVDAKKINDLGDSLLRTFDNCLIDEPIDLETLTISERDVIQYVRSVREDTDWKTGQWKTMSDKQRSRLRERHRKIVNKYGATIRPMVRTLIVDKWRQLSVNRPVLQEVQTSSNHPEKPTDNQKSLIVVKPDQTDSLFSFFAQNTSSTKENVSVSSRENFRFCLVTGIDISRQPPATKFVSKSTLLDLYDHNPKEFYRLAEEFSSVGRRAGNDDVDGWAYKIAHNIRNRCHNPSNNLRAKIRKNKEKKLPLFPDYQIRLSNHDRQLLKRFEGTPYEITL